ncbi:hypothetical protein JOD97_004294 [Duganella sp. 1411]|uniref:LysM peptidoglycan-binding domain-containing protein n=1 Tax=Duganella sp. 1411 TaxID=2806572 RepID=UPI001AE81323|nr:LysM peptidoglycan-binding domain-containing protein [Duganella sp. 1411]MBP1206221.1 hypothetical protein [Duganella sp. 1411]
MTTTALSPAKVRSSYEKWQETIAASLKNPQWHSYDSDLQRIVSTFNRHLSGKGGYFPLDWHLIKAIIWTESGGPQQPAWRNNPMQIGNVGDPGLAALLSGKEGGDLIMPTDLKRTLTTTSVRSSAQMNISAGIAYLLMRMARFDIATVPDDKDQKVYEVVVTTGDSLEKIARTNGSTVDTLKKLNPGTSILKLGHTLKYRKASIQKVIVGWDMVTTSAIAKRYNVGDPAYAKKLNYCLAVMCKSAAGDKGAP